MAIPKSEINAVVAVLVDESLDEATNEEVALKIIETLTSVRDKRSLYVAVSQQRLHPEDKWSTFAIGPFSTELQAAKAGEGMAVRPGHAGEGKWKVGVMMPTAVSTWKTLQEADAQKVKEDRFHWVKEHAKTTTPEEWSEPEGRVSW